MFIDISSIVHSLPYLLRRHKLIQILLLVSPQSCIQLVEFNNAAKLYADMSDEESRNCLLRGKFEPEFFSIAKLFLAKGGNFFDIGANFGFCSFGLIGGLPPEAEVNYHLFEANRNICELLYKSATIHPHQTIKINNCCVTDKAGVSRLKVFKQSSGQSFIAEEGQQEVSNLILDEYIQQNLIEKIHFMKVDIEGWEFFALRGAINSLKRGVVDVIYFEAISAHMARVGVDVGQLFELLQDAGFQLFYCKTNDFKNRIADHSRTFTLKAHGNSLKLASLDLKNLPPKLHTDLLAIHKNTNFLSQLS